MAKQIVYKLLVISNREEVPVTETSDDETHQLIKELQKSLDEVKTKLEEGTTSDSNKTSDNTDLKELIGYAKEIRDIDSLQFHWFVYSAILFFGGIMLYFFYSLFRKFY